MTAGSMDLPPEGMLLGGVALAGDPSRGTPATEGLNLLFTTTGITVQGPQPGMERLLAWAGLDAAACRDQTQLPGGHIATVLSLTSGRQTIHFLLPGETVSPGQAAYLDQALPAWLSRYRSVSAAAAAAAAAAVGTTASPGGSGPMTAPMQSPSGVTPGAPVGPGGAPMADPAATAAAAAAMFGSDIPAATIDPVTGIARWDDPNPTEPATRGGLSRRARKAGPTRLDPSPPQGATSSRPGSRRQLVLLVVLLVVIIAAGGVYLAKHKTNNASPPATVTQTTSAASAARALAATVNLRQGDLPTGWVPASPAATSAITTRSSALVSASSSSASEVASPSSTAPLPSRSALEAAVPALATCLSTPAPTVGALFGGAYGSAVLGVASSPLFVNPADPGVQLSSTTMVLQTASDARFDAAVFAKADFLTCYTQFQTAVAAAAAAGSKAQVVPVPLTSPTGVTVFGYLTTVSIPGQGNEVLGNAFLIGGRIVADLHPSTTGVAVPTGPFTPAFDALAARVSGHLHS